MANSHMDVKRWVLNQKKIQWLLYMKVLGRSALPFQRKPEELLAIYSGTEKLKNFNSNP
jgi:hypothetical protein